MCHTITKMEIGQLVKNLIKKTSIQYNSTNPVYASALATGAALAKKDYKVAGLVVAGYVLYKIKYNKE